NKSDFNRQIKKIKTKQVVFKPLRGSEGKGIIIADKKKIKNKLKSFNGILGFFRHLQRSAGHMQNPP
ncbi:hypothetical protein KKF61_05735, partial [Patescibacteria group bacterium]|nr:hypothetical protein [Patescibacteria group bacterium]